MKQKTIFKRLNCDKCGRYMAAHNFTSKVTWTCKCGNEYTESVPRVIRKQKKKPQTLTKAEQAFSNTISDILGIARQDCGPLEPIKKPKLHRNHSNVKYHMCDQILDYHSNSNQTCRKKARYGIQVIGNCWNPNNNTYEPINPEGFISSYYCKRHIGPFRHKNHREIHKVVPL